MKKPGITVGLVSFHNGTIEIPRETAIPDGAIIGKAALPWNYGKYRHRVSRKQEKGRKYYPRNKQVKAFLGYESQATE